MIILTVKQWGYDDCIIQYSTWIRICRAIVTQVAYDNGFLKLLSYNENSDWNDKVNQFIDNGSEGSINILKTNRNRTITYVIKYCDELLYKTGVMCSQ